jgi:hypothetical protein
MNVPFKKYLLNKTKATSIEKVEFIQALWNDYGEIERYRFVGAGVNSVVVKHIIFERKKNHPKGWISGHDRKVKSYQVETSWYQNWSGRCDENCRVPAFIGSCTEGNEMWIILEDISSEFPLVKKEVSEKEIRTCLAWLAHFHARFLHQKPEGLWATGTYWHLETRPDEFEKIENEEVQEKAHWLDNLLSTCTFQTIVHGDAKLANFCFSDGVENTQVAAVDFQYVGGGCGMKDVAYFLGSCLESDELFRDEKELLHFYFDELKRALENDNILSDFESLKSEWMKLYPIACADFTRFLLGWNPEHYKINEYQKEKLKSVLTSLDS